MDARDLDRESLGKSQQLHHWKSIVPWKNHMKTTNDVGLTFSVGDTTPWFTIGIERDH